MEFLVGRVDTKGDITTFATMAEAVAHIDKLAETDPQGVFNGDYYIDPVDQAI